MDVPAKFFASFRDGTGWNGGDNFGRVEMLGYVWGKDHDKLLGSWLAGSG